MIDVAMLTNPGGRDNNEDFIKMSSHNDDKCFVLCDGLGGHECGEIASKLVADTICDYFEKNGNSSDFLSKAINLAQEELLKLQKEKNMTNAMKTTVVVLVVSDEQVKWAHIGDSRLYHIYSSGTKYERTRDHSLVQVLLDMGEITEKELRNHNDRNKLLRVMGAEWGKKSFELSGVLEIESGHGFALMTDGFWEYVTEDEMMNLYNTTENAEQWLKEMEKIVVSKADMSTTDNYSAICVKVN